ncbi:ribokinase [Bacillus sp. FJAT-49705]|uniref:Ribokinase n=1 Tax=Cytobacillus citreus TaxID=2833586 RepID=A0ABS5NPH9_9BACI|nr:ribokinase [Cytobacillus citreus]MBS4189744.1 ribokinase [Cytobacillus citreus]
MGKIAVVGSINIDYFIETDRLPKLGETVLGKSFFISLGGKGANQAVAASRLGGEVSLFGSIGDDENSKVLKEKMEKEEVDLSYIHTVKDTPSGAAFIELCNSDNRILVVPGANKNTDVSYINRVVSELLSYDVTLFQLETPIEMIEHIVPILYDHGKTIILNPAPARKMKTEIIEKITYLTPNEHEFEMVLNSKDQMVDCLRKYPNKLIITCGTKGVAYFNGEKCINVPVVKVEAVDTTGAGDTFSGAFAVAISEGKNLFDSIQFGNAAAGLSVTKKGAQAGMPYRKEVDSLMKERLDHESKGHIY